LKFWAKADDHSDAEEGYMLKVAGYVDEKCRHSQGTEAGKQVPTSRLLAALNIADEYHRLKESHEAILNR